MVFKLVRTDISDPCKIQLPLGVHMIGRGKFLDCEDKRVSRQHGQLEVTGDAVNIKSLHQNPCFYTKKGSNETQILKQSCSVSLANGDKFGLLPENCWYEIIFCTSDEVKDTDTEKTEEAVTQNNSEAMLQTEDPNVLGQMNDDLNLTMIATLDAVERPDSPSIVQGTEVFDGRASPSFTQSDKDLEDLCTTTTTSVITCETSATNSTTNIQVAPVKEELNRKSPPKRPLSPHNTNGEEKRVKVEADESNNGQNNVKREPDSPDTKPGPSGDQGNVPNPNNGNAVPGAPPSPAKPQVGRERCMYGANCYRRNPAHKVQFSHPSDSDWGPGPKAPCPWGAGCRRPDPRHWRDHDHPPGTLPPVHNAQGMRVVQRHGNVFFINAHSVHFHDDHFQVEDSDGDSVDYDYEF